MHTPTIDQIKADMSKEELATLNRRTARKLATHVVGLMFLKIAIPKVVGNLATKAAIVASKKL